MKNTYQARGFTLIEVMIAVALLAVIATLSFIAIRAAVEAQLAIQQRAERQAELETALALIRNDLFNLVARPVRDDLQRQLAALALGNARTAYDLEFTRTAVSPFFAAEVGLQRAAYHLENALLKRISWPVLDRPTGTMVQHTTLLRGVAAFQVQVLDENLQPLQSWPIINNDGQVAVDILPRAIKIRIELEDWGEFNILIPGVQSISAADDL